MASVGWFLSSGVYSATKCSLIFLLLDSSITFFSNMTPISSSFLIIFVHLTSFCLFCVTFPVCTNLFSFMTVLIFAFFLLINSFSFTVVFYLVLLASYFEVFLHFSPIPVYCFIIRICIPSLS